jgi:hypothetical protein
VLVLVCALSGLGLTLAHEAVPPLLQHVPSVRPGRQFG